MIDTTAKIANNFSLLIKPASADCNLNCAYCFYLEKSGLYRDEKRHRMSDQVLERVVQSYMQTDQDVYSFGWQGGEPTLMGSAFFERAVSLQQKYGKPRSSVANGLQTNATLIDKPFAEHLAKYRFLVGCSLDGSRTIHDIYRTAKTGQGSYSRVVKGIRLLKEAGVSYNILVLVSQANVKKARELYRYLCSEGHMYQQYIPCVEFDDTGNLQPYSINGHEWGEFLCELFDEWYQNDIRRVSIRHFDSILSKIVDDSITVCTLGRNCCQYFVVEYNGDVYPCDFFVDPHLLLGNIMTHSWEELAANQRYIDFGLQKSDWNQKCGSCEYLNLCSADCLKHRIYSSNNSQNFSYLCDGWARFFQHTLCRFKKLAEIITKERKHSEIIDKPDRSHQKKKKKPGRNESCPCGSGFKYKKCCGRG